MKGIKGGIVIATIAMALSLFCGVHAYAAETNEGSAVITETSEEKCSSNDTDSSNFKQENKTQQDALENKQDSSGIEVVENISQDNSVKEESVSVQMLSGLYYKPNAYLTDDQNTALLTLVTNDSNVCGVSFNVWTGDGSNMRGYNGYFQPDGRFMAFVPVSDFRQAGTYNCLATVRFYDGHEENAGFAFFDVTQPSIGSVSIENVDGHNGTFDVLLTGIDCPSSATSIDVVVFTAQDLSDAYVYQAYWNGRGFVANINVCHHQYHFGTYGISATIHGVNGTNGSASQCGTITLPQSQLSTYTADGVNYFLIAENTPADPSTAWVNFYVWNQGISDLKVYRGYRDGSRWLSIVPVWDYMKTGTYSIIAKSQMAFGPEIELGSTSFNVKGSSIGSVYAYNCNDRAGTFSVAIKNPQALSGVTGIRTVVFTKPDWSDAYIYGCLDFGNGVYALAGDIANHRYSYGKYQAAVLVRNGLGMEDLVGVTYFDINHVDGSSVAWPINGDADVTLSAWDLPCLSHVFGVRFYVWNSPDGSDMRSYATIMRNGDNSYSYTFSMSDYGKMGTYYVLPEIVRNDLTTERMPLNSFTIYNINGNYGIMGSSGTNVDQMVRYFNKYGSYPLYYQQGNGGASSVFDFCRIFYEECIAENVRAEVAFCQAMKETGYLRFGGAVVPAAYNFAGIGAVDSSPGSFNWFPDIRTGIRAQVQHLKAYASYDSLNNPCVDPRFSLITRGCAPCVEDLGGRWASGGNYGYSIRNDYMSKLFAS